MICEPVSYCADSDAAAIDFVSLLVLNWFAKRLSMSFFFFFLAGITCLVKHPVSCAAQKCFSDAR